MEAALAVPERTIEQRMTALRRANTIRSKRANMKRDLKAGKLTVRQLLIEPPDFAHSMKVFDLLVAVPKVGRVKANKALQMLHVSPSKTLAGLTHRQRSELVARFG